MCRTGKGHQTEAAALPAAALPGDAPPSSCHQIVAPASKIPLACAGLNPGWTPPTTLSKGSITSRLRGHQLLSVV